MEEINRELAMFDVLLSRNFERKRYEKHQKKKHNLYSFYLVGVLGVLLATVVPTR